MNDPLNTHFGARLREARLQKGMTVADLASAMGIEISVLERYEAGEERITSGRLVRLCDLLRVNPLYFFKDEER